MPHSTSDDRTLRCDECGGYMWRDRCADPVCPGHETRGMLEVDYARFQRMLPMTLDQHKEGDRPC